MTLSASQLSRSERILFGVALIVAVLVVAVRIGAVLIASYLHHIRWVPNRSFGRADGASM